MKGISGVCGLLMAILLAYSSQTLAELNEGGANGKQQDPEMAQLQQIGSGAVLPKWKFLGDYTDEYGQMKFVFFAANTIQKKKAYTDVVVGNWHNRSRAGDSPESVISDIQEGKILANSLTITHVHCDTEVISSLDFSGAKMFEMQLVSYVCAHKKN
jgi:hypothetical protein